MWRVLFLYIVKKRDMSYGQGAIWPPEEKEIYRDNSTFSTGKEIRLLKGVHIF
jgi:hypothetical protein